MEWKTLEVGLYGVNCTLLNADGETVLVSAADVPVLTHPFNQCPPGYPPIARPPTLLTLGARRTLSLFAPGGAFADLEVFETPGHTPGGVCYHFPKERLLLSEFLGTGPALSLFFSDCRSASRPFRRAQVSRGGLSPRKTA